MNTLYINYLIQPEYKRKKSGSKGETFKKIGINQVQNVNTFAKIRAYRNFGKNWQNPHT
ncbi:hypothetical protein GXM_07607 [Nostoc sphaeroides CCNUC1]|uniref:Uncharacterized protein n=1 Tax=Nostoc sphaeroides CCNUC1 TaxID=2653204 RepID=A0A5P8WBF5_9NOSO|nr:hypothetical protein GXM_07607 [Nostoc sphaeroides CCNUC1]